MDDAQNGAGHGLAQKLRVELLQICADRRMLFGRIIPAEIEIGGANLLQ